MRGIVGDSKRREVAARLRDEAAHGEMHIRDFLGALCACIKTERNEYRSILLLAELIDPDTTTDTTKSAPDTTKCDRDALLALADEIEIDGAGALDDEDWCKPLLVEYSHRIREACGVSE